MTEFTFTLEDPPASLTRPRVLRARGIHFYPDEYEALDRAAKERGIGVSAIVRQAVREHLKL